MARDCTAKVKNILVWGPYLLTLVEIIEGCAYILHYIQCIL